jgi:hypothetical protein
MLVTEFAVDELEALLRVLGRHKKLFLPRCLHTVARHFFLKKILEHVLYLWAAGNHRIAARGAAARVSVNFRKFSPCIARARHDRAGLTVYPPSRTLEPLAFDEYCRFDTSAFFWRIKLGSLYPPKERRSIKTAIFIES